MGSQPRSPQRVGATLAFVLLAMSGSAARAADRFDPIYDGAFRDAQMAVGSRAAVALSRGAARLAAGDPRLGTLIRARQEAGDAIVAASAAEVAARAAAAPDPGAIAAASHALGQARAALERADAALAGQAPAYRQLTAMAPVGAAEAQHLLARDEAILLIAPADDATYVFALTAGRHDWQRSSIDAARLTQEVIALRARLDPGGATRAGEDAAPEARRHGGGFDRARAYMLYRALWQPFERQLAGARTVYVVQGGALGALPLSLLVTRPPKGRDDDPAALRRTAWLIRRHALVTLPSVGSLRALRAAAPTPKRMTGQSFMGFGDPLFAAADDVGRALPPLPGTRAELAALAAVMGAGADSIVAGAAATEAAIRRARLADTRVIAFATHGLLAGQAAGAEPALAFTPPASPGPADDGLLTASEAATLTLSADWVILSACNTAGSDGRPGGEGLSGLARGFFSAGARAVLASHWRVRDDIAATLTGGTLLAYRQRPVRGRAGALRHAMLRMIDDRANPERSDPALWAPFVVAGEGR